MTRVLAYHKEKGLITTHRDELGRETVYDRLRLRWPRDAERWHAIGRLDADTTGLLLFTDDGALVSYATRPDSPAGDKVEKVYRVLARGLLSEAQLVALRDGVELSGGLGRSGPAKVEVLGFQVATTWIELTIGEGKNRQVRRMLLAVGSQVIRLCRVRIGGLRLEELVPNEGDWRELTQDEIEAGLGYRVRPDTRLSATLESRPQGGHGGPPLQHPGGRDGRHEVQHPGGRDARHDVRPTGGLTGSGRTPRAGTSRRPDRSRGARRPR